DDPPGPEAFLAHPHPRREMLKECLFVGLPLAGVLIGLLVAAQAVRTGHAQTTVEPAWLRVLGGGVCGYLAGGGLIWGTRILGTLAFGREAMGLGDVHLLAAVGAVVGWGDSVLIFVVAPFIGLAVSVVVIGISRMAKGQVRVIPYGPYLAAAAVIVMLVGQPLLELFGIF
ncbi:MAG: A24 family peptidase, partial [Phycisphaeraceae bacterium]